MIGLAGLQSGAGCTHMALALASYRAGVSGKKTAYLDFTGQGQIESLQRLFLEEDSQEKGFCLNGIDYYYNLNSREYGSVWKKQYECIILDFGTRWREEDYFLEYSRCQRKFLACDFCDWKKQEVIAKVNQSDRNQLLELEMEFVSSFGKISKEDHNWFRKQTGFYLRSLGWIQDPFNLERKEVLQIRNLFQKQLFQNRWW